MENKKIEYADDDTESVKLLLRLRLPPLAVGLVLGLALSFVVSRFEEVIAADVSVAFFIPVIVYLAAAVGNQTQSIYTRDLKTGKANFQIEKISDNQSRLIAYVEYGNKFFDKVANFLVKTSAAKKHIQEEGENIKRYLEQRKFDTK